MMNGHVSLDTFNRVISEIAFNSNQDIITIENNYDNKIEKLEDEARELRIAMNQCLARNRELEHETFRLERKIQEVENHYEYENLKLKSQNTSLEDENEKLKNIILELAKNNPYIREIFLKTYNILLLK